MKTRIIAAIILLPALIPLPPARAGSFDLPTPAFSGAFGTNVIVLPNGNFVVTDPAFIAAGGALNAGAVYLYDGITFAVISTLTGTTANDNVGSGGITVLNNGNFVVASPNWQNGKGAVTWGSTATGVGGTISATNSLIGVATNVLVGTNLMGLGDLVGYGGVTALKNGNYVVASPGWAGLGAVTLGNGLAGVTGFISSTNSLVGIGVESNGVTVLSNGNYIVSELGPLTPGKVTWCNGTNATTGLVSSTNSLVGTVSQDQVGSGGITLLNNGNFVVASPLWNNDVGAVTWGNGTNGVRGVVSSANSLVGSTVDDFVGSVVVPLNNGNYVVVSSDWNNGAATFVGAVTWGSGTTGVAGAVSSANSLVGSTARDQVGSSGVIALNNGSYVVRSLSWHNGAVANAGAVTWGNGLAGLTGVVSSANSLVGSTANDQVGSSGVIALNNGNYVVGSPNWDSGGPLVNAGAATWGNGTTGVTGFISSANSLVGSTASDAVGGGVAALSNGNYIVFSPNWDNGAVVNAGAATWGNGTTGIAGSISAANSLVGSTAGDEVGSSGVTILNNGNYVVRTPAWHNGAAAVAGAVTWGNGLAGVTGVVSSANSLVGTTTNDAVGSGGTILSNGNYLVCSTNWHNGTLARAGAVTWGSGTAGVTGAVSAANSLVGSTTNDAVGSAITTLSNGNYVVVSPFWHNGGVAGAGSVTWGNGTSGVTGVVSPANSLVGSSTNDSLSNAVTALSDGNYVVSSPAWNNGPVAAAAAGAVSLCNGALGTTGPISAANSVLGNWASGGASMVFAYNLLNPHLVVGFPAANRVSLFGYTPKILVQQPLNTNLTNGSTRLVGAPVGANAALTFTISDSDLGLLNGLGVTINGPDSALFTIVTNPAPSVGFRSNSTFTVQFTPLSAGMKTAALHIVSNDPTQNPFNINLTGQVLSFTQDTDGDGLSDAQEFYMSPLGFDWQVSQPNLVSNLFNNANGAGLYTTNQIEALNVDTPLLTKDLQSGQFILTIGVQKSTNLVQFLPFPMTAPQTTIDGQGELEFQFASPDNAAFFRLQAH